MDINTLRVGMTVVSLLTFIGIVLWTLSRQQTQRFQQAAYSVLHEDQDLPIHTELATQNMPQQNTRNLNTRGKRHG